MAIGKSDSIHYQNIADSIRRNLSGAEGGDAVYFPAEMAGGVNAVAEHNYQKGYTDGGGGAVSNGERFIKTIYGTEKNVSVNEAVDQAISDFNAIKFELGNRGAVVSDIEPTENYPGKIVEVYDKGAEAGYSSGKEAGITEGFETGKQAGIAEGYNTGKAEGYNSGYQIGKVDGKNEGYTEGVESGKAEVEAEVKPMLLDALDSTNVLILRPVDTLDDLKYELEDASLRNKNRNKLYLFLDKVITETLYENLYLKRIKLRDSNSYIDADMGMFRGYLIDMGGSKSFYSYSELIIPEIYDPTGELTTDNLNGMAPITIYNLYSPNSGTSKLRTDEDGFVWYVDDERLYLCDYIGKARDISLPVNYEGRAYDVWYGALSGLRIDSLHIPKELNNFTSNGVFENNAFGNDIDIIIGDISEWFAKTFDLIKSNPLMLGTCYICCNGVRITDIVVPNEVASIGKSQFTGYTNMTSITLHNGVMSIGAMAFYSCKSLTKIVLPESLTSIGTNAFSYCSSLEEVVMPESLTSIEGYAFSYCSSLEEAVLPKNLTSIGIYAFQYCSSLKRFVHYGNTLSQSMCAYCSSLTDLIINGNVTTIDRNTFSGCSSLTNVTVNGSIKISNSSLSFSASTKLTVESMVSIMNGLVSNVGGTQYTVYFGSTNLAKLTAAQKAIATNKNIKLA